MVKMLDGSAEWGEKIVAFDDAEMTWGYTITSALPPPFNAFKIDSFVCTMSVKAVQGSEEKCEITIGAKYELAEGVKAEDAPPIEPMYKGWADAAAEHAKTL